MIVVCLLLVSYEEMLRVEMPSWAMSLVGLI